MIVDVAGAVAQAKLEDKTFYLVWNGEGCCGDRKHAHRITEKHPDVTIEAAVEKVTAKFNDPKVWNALCELADRLEIGKMSGRQAWEIYSTALAAQQPKDTELEPVPDFVPPVVNIPLEGVSS
jgi:hypothetical protein